MPRNRAVPTARTVIGQLIQGSGSVKKRPYTALVAPRKKNVRPHRTLTLHLSHSLDEVGLQANLRKEKQLNDGFEC